MRCHYLSDLHLECQTFEMPLPHGDVLIVAGDLCNACCFNAAPQDIYHHRQRDRVLRFIDKALARFPHVLMIAGNHEHYRLQREDTATVLRCSLLGVTILDDDLVDIDGIRFFGGTLWTDFRNGDQACMDAVRKRRGEYFFVKTRTSNATAPSRKFQPEDALLHHRATWAALEQACASSSAPHVAIFHHPPSLKGLNPRRSSPELDCCDASDLDDRIAALDGIAVIIHGHTHIAARYAIADTNVLSNAYGVPSKGHGGRGFDVAAKFEI